MTKKTAVIASGVRVEGSSDVLLRYPIPAGAGQRPRIKVISDIPDRAEARMRSDLKQYGINEVQLRWAPPIPLAERTNRGGPVTSPGDDTPTAM